MVKTKLTVGLEGMVDFVRECCSVLECRSELDRDIHPLPRVLLPLRVQEDPVGTILPRLSFISFLRWDAKSIVESHGSSGGNPFPRKHSVPSPNQTRSNLHGVQLVRFIL